MTESLSILEFLQKMIDDVGLRDWFADEPQQALAHYGLRDISPEDVRDAIVLADDSQTADFSRSVDNSFHGTVGAAAAHHSGGHYEGGHSEGHREAVEHLSRYVTNNFVNDRSTDNGPAVWPPLLGRALEDQDGRKTAHDHARGTGKGAR